MDADRLDFLDERIDHAMERIEALEDKESHSLNRWMLWLFVAEVLIGLVELWRLRG